MVKQKEIEQLYQAYDELLGIHIHTLWDIQTVQDHFQELLDLLSTVVNRKDLEKFEEKYREVDEKLEQFSQRIAEKVLEEDQKQYYLLTEETEENSKEVEDGILDKKAKIDYQERVVSNTSQGYDRITKQSEDMIETVKMHRQKLQDYLRKIDQIRAIEITVYRSQIVDHGLSLVGQMIRRSVEAKLLSTVVPKKMAHLYLATKIVGDVKKLMQEEDVLVITRKEADTSYYDEIQFDQSSMKNYQGQLEEVLIEIKSLQNEYKKSCDGFPDDGIYRENMKKLEELEDILLQEALEVEEVVDDYDEVMDYNNQKVKSLTD